MIVAREVQHAMQDKDFDFIARGVPEPSRIRGRNLRRNGQVTCGLCDELISREERKYVSGFVFFAKALVQATHFPAGRHQDADGPRHLCGTAGALGKP
jgi:hypothetical protein